jgi:predicted nucleic acid-binding protein
MAIVVDSNLVAALLLPLPYTQQAVAKHDLWTGAGEELAAPALMEYEVCSTLHRLTRAGWIRPERAAELLVDMRELAIRTVPPTIELHRAALQWAQRLERSRTYDAQYMALAEELRADFWTCDLPLFNRAQQLGVTWVHCILAPSQPSA